MVCFSAEGLVGVPTIPRIQEMVEQAWQEGQLYVCVLYNDNELMTGFDAVGCTRLNGHVKGTRKWIGTTEVVSLLRMHNIR